jgi:hypothetical protein
VDLGNKPIFWVPADRRKVLAVCGSKVLLGGRRVTIEVRSFQFYILPTQIVFFLDHMLSGIFVAWSLERFLELM